MTVRMEMDQLKVSLSTLTKAHNAGLKRKRLSSLLARLSTATTAF